jgi:hypothetical protein
MSFGYDPELPAGFQDADFEQRAFEEESRVFVANLRRSEKLRASGKLAEAADACPHGGGFPLDSLAARNDNDPNAGEDGYRCRDCGSRLSASPWDGGYVTVPCEVALGA